MDGWLYDVYDYVIQVDQYLFVGVFVFDVDDVVVFGFDFVVY